MILKNQLHIDDRCY